MLKKSVSIYAVFTRLHYKFTDVMFIPTVVI